MANIFITSDPHFGHANILKFTREDGSLMRCFPDALTMDEYIIEQWNSVVRPQDKVYCLGDVAIKRRDIATVGRCNGHKRLVRGNHDIYKTKDYLQFFEEIYAYRKIENLFMSHIPIHPESIRHDWVNVHGHVHNNVGPLHFGPRYFNVCVEVTNYRPLAIEEVRQLTKGQTDAKQQCNVNEPRGV
jgi:calcineurin-like phosphoesterase family protein